MAKLKPKPSVVVAPPPPPLRRPVPTHYYASIARISALLLIGQLAMTTFLLSAGLQHPKLFFILFFYVALGSLGLNLVLYALGELLVGTDEPPAAKRAFIRYIQQGVFIVSVVAVIGFAVATSLLFFGSISSQSAPPASASAQPSGA